MVGQVDLPVNLLEFPLEGFEIIVGVDWLGKYEAKIDCRQKRVSLKGPKGTKVSYRGFVVMPKMKLIALMTLKSCLRKKCPFILCHIWDTRVEEPSSIDIPVVSEFGDVFSDEIPGLSPKRDIDFSVELKPGTGPISKAPYRIGPKELEELKKQLDELLDKGHIRPSVSPWGAPVLFNGMVIAYALRQAKPYEKNYPTHDLELGVVRVKGEQRRPQDGQTKRTIKTLGYMLRACAMEFGGNWEDRMDLIEFSYNNSYHSSIGMTPFDALYDRKCRSLFYWDDSAKAVILGPQMVQDIIDQVHLICQKMKAAQHRQKSYADLHRTDIEFAVSDKVLLKVSPMRGVMRLGKRGKLSQKFIGFYEILDQIGVVTYQLFLPPSLDRVHNVFRVSQL
ncbi:uncharacterized protein LOC141628754 [Silene latifolia]|uniref:uncharacterized protein LOC141628754 n=1 Tax=Silene latifolia TaxID=37657 RepID=UPI003D783DCE